MAGKLSMDDTLLSHLGYLLFFFPHICFSLWHSPADQTHCPLSTQIEYLLASVKVSTEKKSGCLYVSMKEMNAASCLLEGKPGLVLQRPVASIHAVRWVRSSHCGTNVWHTARSTKSGEEPSSVGQQQRDSAVSSFHCSSVCTAGLSGAFISEHGSIFPL